MKYDPKNFSDLFATALGANLWKHLQRPTTILEMRVATKLRRPAVEAIGDGLVEEFGDHVRENRFKQMIGHMVRQLLESEGYDMFWMHSEFRFDSMVFSQPARDI